jgi:hypothetical protein
MLENIDFEQTHTEKLPPRDNLRTKMGDFQSTQEKIDSIEPPMRSSQNVLGLNSSLKVTEMILNERPGGAQVLELSESQELDKKSRSQEIRDFVNKKKALIAEGMCRDSNPSLLSESGEFSKPPNVEENNSAMLSGEIVYYRAKVDGKYWFNVTHQDIMDIGADPFPKRSFYFYVKEFRP